MHIISFPIFVYVNVNLSGLKIDQKCIKASHVCYQNNPYIFLHTMDVFITSYIMLYPSILSGFKVAFFVQVES